MPNHVGMLIIRFITVAMIASSGLFHLGLATTAISSNTSLSRSAQTAASFLSPPFSATAFVTSYFDHDSPYYGRNQRIVLFDGSVALASNGICGLNSAGQSIAYYSNPNGGGECIWYDGHSGYDFSLDYEPVLAAADGQVVSARWWNWADRSEAYGLFVEVSHQDNYVTRYGHLSAIGAPTYTQVYRGEVIGTSGNTGNSSGAHLHFEVLQNGAPVDPYGGGGMPWLWLTSVGSRSQLTGRPPRQFGAVYVVDDDDPTYAGDPYDDLNFTKGRTSPT